MVRLLLILFLSFIIVGGCKQASADTESCQEALDQYHSAKSDLSDVLHAYASCIQASDGHDDCSSEFSTLHSAQDDFESAVSQYESECS
jgi:hypothetical protein